MIKTPPYARAGIVSAFLVLAGSSAIAAPESYEKPALGHAVLAKVLGTVCPGTLTPPEVSEVTAFIGRWVSTMQENGNHVNVEKTFVQVLEASYTEKYRGPGQCADASAREKALSILNNVRKATSDPEFWADLRAWAART